MTYSCSDGILTGHMSTDIPVENRGTLAVFFFDRFPFPYDPPEPRQFFLGHRVKASYVDIDKAAQMGLTQV